MTTKTSILEQRVDKLSAALDATLQGCTTLEQRVVTLEARLDKAATVVAELRKQLAAKSLPVSTYTPLREKPLSKLDLAKWHRALSEIRTERGLSATAFVAKSDVLARIAQNDAPASEEVA
jgi:hypothetical protein